MILRVNQFKLASAFHFVFTLVFGLVFGLVSVMAASGSAFASTQTVTMLDKGEPWEGMSFHDGHLWVGRSRKGFSSDYSLEIFNKDLKSVATLRLNHSLVYITPYGQHSVIIVGTGFNPNLTHYTIVENRQGNFTAKDHVIRLGWANHWIGNLGGKEFFTDMGGNPNDPEGDNNPNLPAQTFFTVAMNGMEKYLSVRLRMPFGGVKVGSAFYVLQGDGIGSPRTNLVRLDPAMNSVQPLFANPRNGFTRLVAVPGTNLIAANESGAQQLLVVDTQQSKLLSSTPIGGGTLRTLTPFRKCVLVASDDARTITAVKIQNPSQPETIGTLPIGMDANEFKSLTKMVADSENGRIYVRSNYPCNPMMQTCDKEWNRVISFEGAEVAKIVESCR